MSRKSVEADVNRKFDMQNGDHIKARADVERTISSLLLEEYPSLFSRYQNY